MNLRLTNSQCESIATALSQCKSLRYLSLWNIVNTSNNLTPIEDFKKLFMSIKCCDSLEYLVIWNTKIVNTPDAETPRVLVSSLSKCPVHSIYLLDNNIDDHNIRRFCFLKKTNLKNLTIAFNKISKIGADIVIEKVQEDWRKANINLSYNRIENSHEALVDRRRSSIFSLSYDPALYRKKYDIGNIDAQSIFSPEEKEIIFITYFNKLLIHDGFSYLLYQTIKAYTKNISVFSIACQIIIQHLSSLTENNPFLSTTQYFRFLLLFTIFANIDEYSKKQSIITAIQGIINQSFSYSDNIELDESVFSRLRNCSLIISIDQLKNNLIEYICSQINLLQSNYDCKEFSYQKAKNIINLLLKEEKNKLKLAQLKKLLLLNDIINSVGFRQYSQSIILCLQCPDIKMILNKFYGTCNIVFLEEILTHAENFKNKDWCMENLSNRTITLFDLHQELSNSSTIRYQNVISTLRTLKSLLPEIHTQEIIINFKAWLNNTYPNDFVDFIISQNELTCHKFLFEHWLLNIKEDSSYYQLTQEVINKLTLSFHSNLNIGYLIRKIGDEIANIHPLSDYLNLLCASFTLQIGELPFVHYFINQIKNESYKNKMITPLSSTVPLISQIGDPKFFIFCLVGLDPNDYDDKFIIEFKEVAKRYKNNEKLDKMDELSSIYYAICLFSQTLQAKITPQQLVSLYVSRLYYAFYDAEQNTGNKWIKYLSRFLPSSHIDSSQLNLGFSFISYLIILDKDNVIKLLLNNEHLSEFLHYAKEIFLFKIEFSKEREKETIAINCFIEELNNLFKDHKINYYVPLIEYKDYFYPEERINSSYSYKSFGLRLIDY